MDTNIPQIATSFLLLALPLRVPILPVILGVRYGSSFVGAEDKRADAGADLVVTILACAHRDDQRESVVLDERICCSDWSCEYSGASEQEGESDENRGVFLHDGFRGAASRRQQNRIAG
jgi:hypothetical protein